MKQIFTLFAAVIAAVSSFAQTQNFDAGRAALVANCWQFSANTSFVPGISGVSVATHHTEISDITTPYYATGNVAVSFAYRLSEDLKGSATRSIFVGTTDRNGVFTQMFSQVLDNKSNINGTITTPQFAITGESRRITVRVDGHKGVGQIIVLIDDLVITGAAPRYAESGSTCNSAPVAVDDFFPGAPRTPISGNVLENDTDPNTNERPVMATLVAAPSVGALTLNQNGSFTYTPPATGFSGGPVTFTYRVTDNGFDPLQSANFATVTLDYPENAIILPVKLESFKGAVQNSKAQLQWQVADNENAKKFEIQHSANGVDFTTVGVVFAGNGAGQASYKFANAITPGQKNYYRLKIWDTENLFEFSNVVLLHTSGSAAGQTLQLWQPSGNQLGLRFSTATAQHMQAIVADLSGRVLHQQTLRANSGSNQATITLNSQLKPGVYLVQLQANGATFSGKVLVP